MGWKGGIETRTLLRMRGSAGGSRADRANPRGPKPRPRKQKGEGTPDGWVKSRRGSLPS
jgi:hypothetical protein